MNTFQSNKILHFLQSQSLSLSLACYLIIPIHLNEKMLNRSSQILASVVNQIDLEKRGGLISSCAAATTTTVTCLTKQFCLIIFTMMVVVVV